MSTSTSVDNLLVYLLNGATLPVKTLCPWSFSPLGLLDLTLNQTGVEEELGLVDARETIGLTDKAVSKTFPGIGLFLGTQPVVRLIWEARQVVKRLNESLIHLSVH